MKIRFVMLVVIIAITTASCSGEVKPPTCDVYVSGGSINVVIDLPAEETKYRNMHELTPSGLSGIPNKVTINAGGSSVEFPQTGNSYNINYTVTYEDGDITDYHISIKGNVYGDVEHTCTK
ncbi:MAG: hypothetical protein KJZ77_09665 [Anaerolineales bacterium]|nr:hypothetical protein [Anaerolineales bacterium]